MASNEVSFEQATAFNNQLMALKKMGIEFDVGFRRDEDLPTKLRQIESEIVLRSGRGESTCHSLDEALRSADVPKKYRSALLIWSTCDNPTVVLDAISQPARERNELRTELGRHLLYPVFVMVLTLVGFFVFWKFVYPGIEAIYDQLWERSDNSASMLAVFRTGIGYWAPVLILVALAISALIWAFRSSLGPWWIPGRQRSLRWRHSARRAEQLASLTDADVSFDQAKQLVLSDSDRDDLATHNSPLFGWATTQGEPGSGRSEKLRLAAKFYRHLATEYSRNWGVVVPAIVGVFVGGCAVLCYGLSLFQPMADLLTFVSQAGGS